MKNFISKRIPLVVLVTAVGLWSLFMVAYHVGCVYRGDVDITLWEREAMLLAISAALAISLVAWERFLPQLAFVVSVVGLALIGSSLFLDAYYRKWIESHGYEIEQVSRKVYKARRLTDAQVIKEKGVPRDRLDRRDGTAK